jgi:hypothetical protein
MLSAIISSVFSYPALQLALQPLKPETILFGYVGD